MSGNAEMIIARDAARMAASVAQDYDALQDMLCKDLVYVHSSARIDTKESLIGAMKSGDTVYKKLTPSNVTATDLGDAVLVMGNADITVDKAGEEISFSVLFTDVYQNQNGTWRMIAWQSTKTP